MLHEIIANRQQWISTDEENDLLHSWLEGIVATDIWTATDQFDPEQIPQVASIWPSLDSKTQQFLRLLIVNSKVNDERSRILARLAEKRQE